jgi:hypothetical protein
MTISNEQEVFRRKGKSPRKTIAFLFGAGISKAADLPLSLQLTHTVLSGLDQSTARKILRHSNGRYSFGASGSDESTSYLERLMPLLKLLKSDADTYYFNDRESNYEDLYFMLEQTLDSLTFRKSNPIADYYAKHLEASGGYLMKDTYALAVAQREFPPRRASTCPHDISTMTGLLRECCNYILDVVCAMLDRKPERVKYLHWLLDAVADVNSGQKVFFTLNYDTLLEQLFKSADLTLVDGFGRLVESEGLSYFDERLFEDLSSPQLIKLHGSVDWFRSKGGRLQFVKRVEGSKPTKRFELENPVMLIGTHNKTDYYSAPFFAELHAHFRGVLKVSSRMIVSGYSFGDGAINRELFYWLDQRSDNRALVIHPDGSDCKQGAASMAAHFLAQFESRKQVEFLRKPMESANWSESKKLLS